METTKPFREFAGYSGLSVLGMLAISCYILADTFFVSQSLGTNGLAALNLAIPAYNVIHGTGLMVGMGGATRFSVLKSRRESKAADVMFTNTVYLAVFFSALFMLVGVFFSAPITALLGADSATFDMTNTYLKVLCIFAPAFIMNDVLLCFVRNDGNPGLAMAATVGGSFSNIILDYVFMFPMGMGIFGAVLATGMSPAIGILIMAVMEETKNVPVRVCALAAGCAISWVGQCDYNVLGILFITAMYAFRRNDLARLGSGIGLCAAESVSCYCVSALAFVPIAMYNGRRGTLQLKYLLSVFYPVHLLALWGVRLAAG